MAAMLLVSPVSRKAHFVAMLLAFGCGAVLAVRAPRSRATLWMLACVAMYVLASRSVVGDHVGLILRAGGLYTATALVP